MTLNVTIERATAADAERLTAVQVAAFHSDAQTYPGVAIGGPPGYDSVQHTREKIATHDVFAILLDGQIVGGLVVFDRGHGHYHLDLIFIDPAHHNRGIGTRAMAFLEETYAAQKWSLDTPAYALRNQHFYEKLGFVKVGEEAQPDITLFAYEKRSPR